MSLVMTVAGTVESFDAANFKANLAASIGVAPAAVTLTVTAASVNVAASIKVTENATGVVASVKALASDSSALSKAVGVTIESVAAPTFSVRAILAPSPPPPPAPPPGGYSPPPPLPPAPYGRESSEFIRAGSTVSELALTLLLAGGGAVLLLLLGYCLLRRPHGKTRKQIARDVHGGPEAEASAQDAVETAEAGAEPQPELEVADSRPVARGDAVRISVVDSPLRPPSQQDRVKASRLNPRARRPMRPPHAGLLSGRGMRSSAAAKEITNGRDRRTRASRETSPAGLEAEPEADPATDGCATDGCGARAIDGGGSGQADPLANGQLWLGIANLQLAVSTDYLAPSALPAPEHRITPRGVGQGKLTDAVEAAPMSKAARSCRSRASIKDSEAELAKAARSCRSRASIKDSEAELAKMFALGARGTKDGPGRSTSRGTIRPRPPTPRKGKPDLWAAVRAQRAAIQAANALRKRDAHLPAVAKVTQALRRRRSHGGAEGVSSCGGGDIVRV